MGIIVYSSHYTLCASKDLLLVNEVNTSASVWPDTKPVLSFKRTR